ncbi:MAG: hypothetical protein H6719_16325 [Sandaracinaceae bacterium]|nr:hypothetical protein [Sandaracinaceae bacterium]
MLPARPLRLRSDFVRGAWARVLGAWAPMLVLLAVVGLWQGRAAYTLAADMAVWSSGEPTPVRLLSSDVTVIAGLVRHVRVRAEFGRTVATGANAPDHHYVVAEDYYTFFTDSVGDGPLTMRRDPGAGRVALSWAMQDAAGRWAWIAVFGLIFLGFAGFLARVAWRALRALRVARAAAVSSDEVELEVVSIVPHHGNGALVALEIAYRVPPSPDDGPATYRAPAADPVQTFTERFELVDGRPLLLDDGAHLLALRPDRRRPDVTVLREDGGPFELDPAALAALGRRVAEHREAVPG